MLVPYPKAPQHGQGSTEGLVFSGGSLGKAEKLPSLLVEIQQIKAVLGKGTSQVFPAKLYHFFLLKMCDPLPAPFQHYSNPSAQHKTASQPASETEPG